jgi:hypothetical protein
MIAADQRPTGSGARLDEGVVLVVDDEPAVLTALTRLLRPDGVRVLTRSGSCRVRPLCSSAMPEPPSVVPARPRCLSPAAKRDGRSAPGCQRLRCGSCRRSFTERTGTPFAGYRWLREVIVMAVRWYGRFRLSVADVRDLLAERGTCGRACIVPAGRRPNPSSAPMCRSRIGSVLCAACSRCGPASA